MSFQSKKLCLNGAKSSHGLQNVNDWMEIECGSECQCEQLIFWTMRLKIAYVIVLIYVGCPIETVRSNEKYLVHTIIVLYLSIQ